MGKREGLQEGYVLLIGGGERMRETRRWVELCRIDLSDVPWMMIVSVGFCGNVGRFPLMYKSYLYGVDIL